MQGMFSVYTFNRNGIGLTLNVVKPAGATSTSKLPVLVVSHSRALQNCYVLMFIYSGFLEVSRTLYG